MAAAASRFSSPVRGARRASRRPICAYLSLLGCIACLAASKPVMGAFPTARVGGTADVDHQLANLFKDGQVVTVMPVTLFEVLSVAFAKTDAEEQKVTLRGRNFDAEAVAKEINRVRANQLPPGPDFQSKYFEIIVGRFTAGERFVHQASTVAQYTVRAGGAIYTGGAIYKGTLRFAERSYANAQQYINEADKAGLFADPSTYIPQAYHLVRQGQLDRTGDPFLLRAFLQKAKETRQLGAVLDYVDADGLSLLGYAARVQADIVILELLQEYGADLYSFEMKYLTHRSPLSVLFSVGHPYTEVLLKNWASSLWQAIDRDARVPAHVLMGLNGLATPDPERALELYNLFNAERPLTIDNSSLHDKSWTALTTVLGVVAAAGYSIGSALGCCRRAAPIQDEEVVREDLAGRAAGSRAGSSETAGSLASEIIQNTAAHERAESPDSVGVSSTGVEAEEPSAVVLPEPSVEEIVTGTSTDFLMKKRIALFKRICDTYKRLIADSPRAKGEIIAELGKLHVDPRKSEQGKGVSLGDLEEAFSILKKRTNEMHYKALAVSAVPLACAAADSSGGTEAVAAVGSDTASLPTPATMTRPGAAGVQGSFLHLSLDRFWPDTAAAAEPTPADLLGAGLLEALNS